MCHGSSQIPADSHTPHNDRQPPCRPSLAPSEVAARIESRQRRSGQAALPGAGGNSERRKTPFVMPVRRWRVPVDPGKDVIVVQTRPANGRSRRGAPREPRPTPDRTIRLRPRRARLRLGRHRLPPRRAVLRPHWPLIRLLRPRSRGRPRLRGLREPLHGRTERSDRNSTARSLLLTPTKRARWRMPEQPPEEAGAAARARLIDRPSALLVDRATAAWRAASGAGSLRGPY